MLPTSNITPYGSFINSSYPPGYRGAGARIRGTGGLDLDPYNYGASYKMPGSRTAAAQAFVNDQAEASRSWFDNLDPRHQRALIMLGAVVIVALFVHFFVHTKFLRDFHKQISGGVATTAITHAAGV